MFSAWGKFWIKKGTFTSFFALGMRSEENTPRNGEPTVGFYFKIMLQHTGQFFFCQRFLSKERDNITAPAAFSWPGSGWFSPVSPTEFSIELTALLRFYLNHYECDGRAEKVLAKWVPGMFPTPSHSLTEVHTCTSGLFWRTCTLHVKDCTVRDS